MDAQSPALSEQQAGRVRFSSRYSMRGLSAESIDRFAQKSETNETYQKEVSGRLESAVSLMAVSRFLGEVRSLVMPAFSNKSQNGRLVSATKRERTLGLALKTGADVKLVEKLLFGQIDADQGEIDRGLVEYSLDIGQSLLPGRDKARQIDQRIANMCTLLYSGRADLSQLFSGEKIAINSPVGEVLVTPFELFSQNPVVFPAKIAGLQRAVAEAYLADPAVAVQDAVVWTKSMSRLFNEGKIDVFPTPYTKAVKDQIDIAHSKRNGLLKYILFGEAGVGKTRLIQEDNTERGKETVVISFHHFISFDELIGQMAVPVDLQRGQSGIERLNQLVDRFSGLDNNSFWQAMEAVYTRLSSEKRQNYPSVEDMVRNYALGLVPAGVEPNQPGVDREGLKDSFIQKIKTIRDTTLLGFEDKDNQSLESRFVQGIIAKIIEQGKGKVVPMFDEMDKAGPHAIEGLLSFLSYSPGQTWRYQGGTVQIPEDFYITATSNKTNIGALTEEEGMNRYLADRAEQIIVKPQPVKDGLMIASVLLSDENGFPLINEREQIYLINAFSFILPRLQKINLSIPITNRVIRTICSRLVDYTDSVGDRRHYQRILDNEGKSVTVAQALRLSILDMKKMSLTPEEVSNLEIVLDQFNQLLGENRIEEFGEDLVISQPDRANDRTSQMNQRLEVLESITSQPLYQAIAKLESDLDSPNSHYERVNPKLTGSVNNLGIGAIALKERAIGRANSICIVPRRDGIYLLANLGPNQILGEAKIMDGQYDNAQVVSADQLGETFVVKKSGESGEVEVIKAGTVLQIQGVIGDKPILVDPRGRFVIFHAVKGLMLGFLEEKDGVFAEMREIILAPPQSEVVDIAGDGQNLLVKDGNGLSVINTAKLAELNQPKVIKLGLDSEARFLGNHLITSDSELIKIST